MRFEVKLLIGLGLVGVAAWLFRDKVSSGVVSVVDKVANYIETSSETKKIEGLIPSAQDALRKLRQRLLELGIRTQVGETRRTQSQQDTKVDSGVSSTKNSWHLLGRAVDLYVYDGNTVDLNGVRVDLYRTMHNEAPAFGWQGLAFNPDGSKRYLTNKQGKKYWDGGHLEFPEGMTFAQAKAQSSLA